MATVYERIWMAIGVLAGALALTFFLTSELRKAEAIDRGYALYCPASGKWAWVGECDE